jgi:hypothetical protein
MAAIEGSINAKLENEEGGLKHLEVRFVASWGRARACQSHTPLSNCALDRRRWES